MAAAAALAAHLRDAGIEAVLGSSLSGAEDHGAEHEERTVEMEWVGERSLFADPVVEYRMLLTRLGQPGGYTPAQLAAIEAAAKLRIIPFPGHTRELSARDGLSRTYRWGHAAGTTTIPVRFRDAETIKALPSGHEFRIVGQEPDPTMLGGGERYVRLVNAQEFDGISRYVWTTTHEKEH